MDMIYAFFTYGPIALGSAMMALMVYTSLRVWRTHKRAMKSLEEYGAALDAATRHMKENPERWLDYHKAIDDRRRMN